MNTSKQTLPAMAISYCLGVFNDNYFKQAAMLLAVAAGLNHLQGWAAMLFALPFILFSAHGGWCADRFSKKTVIICSKAMEIAAMGIGAAGLLTGSWPLILAMIFTMGLQSSFFGPSLNGSIPEQYPVERVPRINALFKLATTLAILAGMATAGISLDQEWIASGDIPFGIVLVSIIVMIIAIIGFLVSFGMKGKPAADPEKTQRVPWFGPWTSLKDLVDICKDRQLFVAILADTYFYFIASIVVLVVNAFGIQQLGFSQTLTSMLSVSLMLGVCTGSFIAAKIVEIGNWSAYLTRSALGIGAGLLLAGSTLYVPENIRFGWLASSLGLAGIAGGLFLIPVTSFLQIRPVNSDKGRVLAAAGFSSFSAILLSGILYTFLEPHMAPAQFMTALGLFGLLASILFYGFRARTSKTQSSLLGYALKTILSVRYSVSVKGLAELALDPTKGTIFLPNHPALIDPVIVMSHLHGQYAPRPLSAAEQANKPGVRQLMKLIRPIILPEVGQGRQDAKSAVHSAINEVVHSLKNGENILFYPAGRLNRKAEEDLRGNSGLEFILKNVPDIQVVLVRTTGLWGSSFSWASGHPPTLSKHIFTYLKAFIVNGLFFGPKRKVTVEFTQNPEVKKLEKRSQINRYLESYYNEQTVTRTHVPYLWWQGREQIDLPEQKQQRNPAEISHIPDSVKKQVMDKLSKLSGSQITTGQRLANELGLDSLTILEMGIWLEQEFGTAIEDPAALETVEDCILAAGGQVAQADEPGIKPPPPEWFCTSTTPLELPQASTVTAAFLQQAVRNPGKIILADQIAGTKSYFQIITAIFALLPTLQRLPGERIGIMLPASVSSAIVYLATLFSGKTPVLFNWTSGIINMKHGIHATGVQHIISARPLCTKIEEQQDICLQNLPVSWIYLDEIIRQLGKVEKIAALGKALFCRKKLSNIKIPETAAILFTSGSEAKPKAVPLTHKNILTNLRDFSTVLGFEGQARLLGMLPPFHSLGLVGTIIMPVCLGLRTVYHANPTEPLKMSRIIDAYKVSLVISTPTFLNGILQAGDNCQLQSLQLAFTGAEKCPDHVIQNFKTAIPHAELCEGYGITECSPLVSINQPGSSRPGTIGKILPSIDYAIVDDLLSARVSKGKQGQLLVRGDSIFAGYLNSDTRKGFCEFENRRWYQTGDYVTQENEHLIFCGRKKRFIKIGGEMISLPAIESTLLEQIDTQTEAGPVLAIEATSIDSHPEIVLFSTKRFEREEVNRILKQAGFSALHNIRRFVQVDTIPVLGTGKTDYNNLQKLLAA